MATIDDFGPYIFDPPPIKFRAILPAGAGTGIIRPFGVGRVVRAAKVSADHVHVVPELLDFEHLLKVDQLIHRHILAIVAGRRGRTRYDNSVWITGLDPFVGVFQHIHIKRRWRDRAAVFDGVVLFVPDLVGLDFATIPFGHLTHKITKFGEITA